MEENILLGWDGEADMETVMGGLKDAMHKRLGWPLVRVSIAGTVINVEGVRYTKCPLRGYSILDSNYSIAYDAGIIGREIYGRIGKLLTYEELCTLHKVLPTITD